MEKIHVLNHDRIQHFYSVFKQQRGTVPAFPRKSTVRDTFCTFTDSNAVFLHVIKWSLCYIISEFKIF